MLLIFLVLLALAFIVLAIIKYDIHPFLALFIGAIGYGLASGMPGALILQSITDGFGGVLGRIGLLILLGVIIGTFLEKTGGAFVIAQKVLSWIGEKSVMLAMMITGYILSIPVFGDSTFIMLNPISKSLSFKGKVPYAATTVALALGATASHSMVPPTPGPIAAAGILGADLGTVIFLGLIISVIALIPCYFFIGYATANINIIPKFAAGEEETSSEKFPSVGKSFLPIVVPLVLIVLSSIANYPTQPFGQNSFTTVLQFIGNPIIALLLGAFMSFALPKKFEIKLLSSSSWVGDALLIAAPIILITGAGGVFGKMLQNSGIADLVSNNLDNARWGLFLPFVMALVLKTAQGSSTVALITTASVMAPLLASLGLDTEMLKVLTVLSIGAGAMAISHANDSFFWVMTQMSGMSVKQGNQSHSLGTLILSCTAMFIIYVITFFI
ncbi:MAG: GntP family permease [Bacteroidetes bacterium]|nr:GntP family permease [Bacteroidota bacterium]MDA1121164.1 GntP family permease [Bacteroidota bacterium]